MVPDVFLVRSMSRYFLSFLPYDEVHRHPLSLFSPLRPQSINLIFPVQEKRDIFFPLLPFLLSIGEGNRDQSLAPCFPVSFLPRRSCRSIKGFSDFLVVSHICFEQHAISLEFLPNEILAMPLQYGTCHLNLF